MASEQIVLPKEFSFGNLGNTLADQLHKKITQVSSLVNYEKPEDTDLTVIEKKQLTIKNKAVNKSIANTLINITHHMRVVLIILDELKSFQSIKYIRQMMGEAEKSA